MYALPRPYLPARCMHGGGSSRAQFVGEVAGAVGRVVVDDERVQLHPVPVRHLADAAEGVAQVLTLVVRGEDDDVHGASISSPERLRRRPRRPSIRQLRPPALRGISPTTRKLCITARTLILK